VNAHSLMKMTRSKKTLAVLGAILLAVVSNALWEYAAKPLILQLRDILLNIATLGIQSFKNDCYRLIAQGFTESPSVKLLFEFNSLYIVAFTWVAAYFVVKAREANLRTRRVDELRHRLSEQPVDQELPQEIEPSVDERRKELANLMIKLRALVWLFVVLAVFAVSWRGLNIVKESYVNKAVSHYKQMYLMCRPYVDEKEAQIIESKFSQIASKQDYSLVLSRLYEIGEKNGIRHQTFSAW
jgi:hypothetical protein